MKRHEAIEQIEEAEDFMSMIERASKEARFPLNNLKVLRNEFEHLLRLREHGERDALWDPQRIAIDSLTALDQKVSDEQWESAFATVRRTLLSIARKYVRAMRSGVQELYPE